jgi:hypothetical protein
MNNPIDNNDASYRIAYQDHALNLQTAQDRQSSDNYLREYRGAIEAVYWDEDHEEGETAAAGDINYSIVKLGLLDSDGADLFTFFDSEGWLLELGECLFDWKTQELKEWITEVIEAPLKSNLLVVHELQLLPKFRGRRLGLAIMKCLLEEYADTCGFAFLDIFPQQFWEGMDAQRKQELRLDDLGRDQERATKRLAEYFHALNLKAVPGTSYLAIHLDYVVPEI